MSRKALISVSNKSGLTEITAVLHQYDIGNLASSGTYKAIKAVGIPVTEVSEFTGAPELMGGRVKTLHPIVHSAILERRSVPTDAEQRLAAGYGDDRIDFVIVNLYPFRETVAKPGVTEAEIIENIDIGGPALIRAAAKNFEDVCVVVDPADYPALIAELQANNGQTTLEFRKRMATKAFGHTHEYDGEITTYFSGGLYQRIGGVKVSPLPYGENRHQLNERAGLYSSGGKDPLALDRFEQIEGASLGYVNWTDIDRTVETICRIATTLDKNERKGKCIAVSSKHGNACGGSAADTPTDAIAKAIDGNPLAIFGGTLGCNFPIGEAEATLLRLRNVPGGGKRILDVIIAPAVSPEAVAILKRKNGRCKILVNPKLDTPTLIVGDRFRQVRGGFLLQPAPAFILDLVHGHPELEVFGPALTDQQTLDLLLAKAICDTSNSNTITIVRDGMLLGNGTSRPSRVEAAEVAIRVAESNGLSLKGAVAASDSFFPFADGPVLLAQVGITAIFATSGSDNDEKVKEALSHWALTLAWAPDGAARGFACH